VSVTDNRTDETYDLDVWSVDGVPFGSPLYINDPTESRREDDHSQQSWDLNVTEVREALNVINTYYESPQDYMLVGNSCATAVTRVLEAVDVEVDALTPTGVWWDVTEIGEQLPGYNQGVCEDHLIPERVSDPEWDRNLGSSDPRAALFGIFEDGASIVEWPLGGGGYGGREDGGDGGRDDGGEDGGYDDGGEDDEDK
jgi:hypothetical protein